VADLGPLCPATANSGVGLVKLALAVAKRCLIGLDPRQYRQAPGETLGRPIRFTFVIFRHRWNVRGNFNPRLLGSGKDVYLRWQVIWLIKRADAHKPDDRTGSGVVAPYRYSALWAACNLLSFPAVRGSVDDLRLSTQMNDAVRLDEGIQRERRAAFSLAPATMATMYEKWSRCHAVADKAAVAATIERKDIAG